MGEFFNIKKYMEGLVSLSSFSSLLGKSRQSSTKLKFCPYSQSEETSQHKCGLSKIPKTVKGQHKLNRKRRDTQLSLSKETFRKIYC